MASVETKYVNKIPQFLRKYNTGKDTSLEQMANLGLGNINGETPIDTGNLLAGNKSKVVQDDVAFYNDEEYAPHVELGTINQSANPFMRRGVNKSKGGFLRILVKNFRI